MMNIKGYLNKKAALVDKNLDKFLPSSKTYPKVIHEAMRYSVFSGGKRVRPILAIEAAGACGGKLSDVMHTACALELIHTYSIIHDDLPAMDDDDYRRGKPTLHKKFDEAIAILAGDALLSLSFNLIAGGKHISRQNRIIREVSKAIGTFGMIGGQVMDIAKEKKDGFILKYIHATKTASLLAVSARSGAIAAGAGKKDEDNLANFGKYLGLSFQIIDDILDKEDYYTLFGKKRSLTDARILVKKAEDSLKPFGKKADTLKEIAMFLLAREK